MQELNEATPKKRRPAHKALFALGQVFLIIGLTSNSALIGVGVVFVVIGAARMSKERKKAGGGSSDSGA